MEATQRQRMTPEESDLLKSLMKEALIEVLQERRDLFHDLVDEALEDIALSQAITEGMESDTIDREDVMKYLLNGL